MTAMSENNKLRRAWAFLCERRKLVFRYGIAAVVLLLLAWTWLYLRPDTWECYTDEIELSATSRSVEPQYVMWDDAAGLEGLFGDGASEPSFSPDGSMMAFSRNGERGSDLFTSVWDGESWQKPSPMRAVNSQFNERTPVFGRDGKTIYFSTDRPGGPGGFDIWVARWDGSEFAWAAPLTSMVNSPYDELSPAPSASSDQLFFSSNRPRLKEIKEEKDVEFIIEEGAEGKASDFDIFSANAIPDGVTNREVERATSMLYYLRESALSDPEVMKRLGGSRDAEKAIDRALDFLAKRQHKDGHWTVPAKGDRHNVAVTSLSLLSFFGRGHRHDRPGKYQDTVDRGLKWLLDQQKVLGSIEGRGDFYDHAMGTLALGEAYGLSKDQDLFDAAHTAIDFIVESQNEDGGWRYKKGQSPSDLSVSGWMVMALKNAELSGLYVPKETFEGAKRFLEMVAGGANGGFFGYQNKQSGTGQPAMRVTGYFCSQLLGLSPNTLQSFEAAEIMGKRGAAADDFYYMYYGTLAANQHQGPIWRDWRKKLPTLLLPAQNGDGSWLGRGRHAQDMGQIVGTALAALSLQAHYRYTPMYGLGYEPDISSSRLAALTRDELPDIPLYRLAKRRYRLSSRGDDIDPVATKHGDFLYFASDRWGGKGGFDIYRSRVSGEKPTKPENVGPAVNSHADETAPATRMAGFNLVFSSSKGQKPALYSSTSRRVRVEYDLSNKPSFLWFLKTFVWHLVLGAVAASVFVYWFRVWRHRRRPLEFRDGLSRAMRAVMIARRWLVPALSSLVLVGCLLAMRSTLYKTAWCFYTDDDGLRRNALVDTVRPVLWSTHLTFGDLNKPMADAVPQFSRDGTRVFLTERRDDETKVIASEWDGVRWEKGRRVEAPEDEEAARDTAGGYRFFAEKSGWRGGRDLYMGRVADDADAKNMGRLVNSKLDDAVPAVRMEGFDLMFASNRGTKDRQQYLLYTSTAREVFKRMNYARWHSFTGMLNRIKWWIVALAAAALGLWYLLKHMKDISSLFHKCLLGSVAVHLIILLLMAGWIISAEFIESIESTAMEISVDVNALAQEKLAMDLQTDITELADVSETAKVEKSQDAPDIPMLNPEVMEDVPEITAEMPDHAFIEEVETARTEDRTEDEIDSKALDPLASFKMEMLEVKPVLEEMPVEEAVEEKEEAESFVVDQPDEVERREVEKVQAKAEEVEAEVPELARAELEKTAHELAAQQGEAEPLAEKAVEVAAIDPLKNVPMFEPVKVEMEEAGAKSLVDEDEFTPAKAQEQFEVDRADERRIETVAAGGPLDPASIAVSIDTNLAASAVAKTFVAQASADARLDGLDSSMPEQLIADVRGIPLEVELEVAKASDSIRDEQPEADAAQMQAKLSIEKADEGIAPTEAVDVAVVKEDVAGEPQALQKGVQVSVSAERPAELKAVTVNDIAEMSPQPPAMLPKGKAMKIIGRPLEVPTASDASTVGSFAPEVGFRHVAAVRRESILPSARAVPLSADMGDVIGGPAAPVTRLLKAVAPDPLSGRSAIDGDAPDMMTVSLPSQPKYIIGSAGPRTMMEIPDAPAGPVGAGEFQPVISQKGVRTLRKAGESLVGSRAMPDDLGVELKPETSAVRTGGSSLSRLKADVSKTREVGKDVPWLEIASAGPGLKMRVDMPGKLNVPSGQALSRIPEIMKDPSRLSDEVITGLGGSGETQASIARALDWFTKTQSKDGRWSLSKHGGNSAHDIGGTSLVLLCFYGWGAKHTQEGDHQDTVKKAIDWLVAQMLENGDLRGWSLHRYEEDKLLGNMYDHAIATIALCEAYGLTRDKSLLEPCRKAVDFLLDSQEKKLGAWRYDPKEDSDTSVLGWAYMALKSAELAGLDLPKETFDRADGWLNGVSMGKHGGLYGYQKPEKKREAMVATGMFCRQLQGVPASDPGMHEGVGYVATHPLNPEELDYYYMYYATLVMYQNQGPVWEEWNERMKEILLASQHKSGSKKGTWDPQKWYGFQMGRVVSTAISTLSLEVYYRILPIYGFGAESTAKAE